MPQYFSVLVFWLVDGVPLILLLTLLGALYLTVIELREFRPHWKWWVWWISFVVLTHFIGYLILRVGRFAQRMRARRA